MNKAIVLWVFLILGFSLPLRAANPGDEVIVIYNTRVPESKSIAEYYAERRHVPTTQLFGFPLSTGADMTRSEFRSSLQEPLAKAIEDQNLWRVTAQIIRGTNGQPQRVLRKPIESKIRYAVICYGVPYRIKRDIDLKEKESAEVRPEFRRNEASVDSDLAMLPSLEEHFPLTGPLTSPLYGSTNEAAFSATSGVLMVTRLDGPSAAIAKGLVDKALQAETNGLWGRAYIDIQGFRDGNYKPGDDWMRAAAEICQKFGFETVMDTNGPTFPAAFPMSQIGFYCGWYDADVSGPFTRPEVEFMPGAFAYHLHSYSAANLRSPTNNWVGPLLAKGATITMGCVEEPYLNGTPDLAVFAARFIVDGFTFGEAAYAAQSVLSWQTVVIGDPLYRPFGKPPQQLHEELVARRSPWREWSFLRIVNLGLARGQSMMQMCAFLEQVPLTKTSALLTTKLADMYAALGKPSSAVEMWGRALKLKPSPMEKIRIRLELSKKLDEINRSEDALEVLEKIIPENPDYPAKAEIYRKLQALAEKSGDRRSAAKYERQIKDLAPAAK